MASDSKALTYTALTGGLFDTVDHAQVLAQKLEVAPTNNTRISSKTSAGFTLNGDSGSYSVAIMATLPNRPLATPKWAKDYCPYCKNLGFNAIVGSVLKDVAILTGVYKCVGGSVVVTFPNLSATNSGATTAPYQAYPSGTKERGGQKESLVTMMYDDQYQIILSKSTEAGAAVTVPPYPSSIGVGGFTLNGDADEFYDILVVGQINF
jgi:hypothetical protein